MDSLLSNTGRFLVGAGRTFTTQAAFSNSGFLSIDVGSQLNVTGNFTQTSAGTLELIIGGLGPSLFGRIAATGDAALAGDLAPITTEDFTSSEGDEFVVLRYNTLLDGRQFESCSSCSIDELLTFTPVYELVQTKLVANQQQ